MDDLSWGTKGLDSGGDGKDQAILDCWKIIKTIHVGKLLFWNVLVAGFLIYFGSDYLLRFWLTLGLMAIIASTMAFKVLCGVVYYFYYLICINNKKTTNNNSRTEESGRARGYADNNGPGLRTKPSLYSSLKETSAESRNRNLIDGLNE